MKRPDFDALAEELLESMERASNVGPTRLVEPEQLVRDALERAWEEGHRAAAEPTRRLRQAATDALRLIGSKLGKDKSRWTSKVVAKLHAVLNV